MNPSLNLNAKKPYIKPTLHVEHIEAEENFAVSSVQPVNDQSEVKQQWEELGDVMEDVDW
ncbi:hypothetical protein ORI89_03250 [Sphingobacterium sp. UT-1RO-CII-1]|uniref:hypothetical protein n=1 Tax=Sphingobacterium sp. UT-1RO-CII-1 TaxID=2995225 RepID=UPI00227C04EF|nr:hypothetical protein [Sphingobacterium sp. UT-1RO-CII-1]MCY4778654.1 hypothetical protein [Sphingobacterium sp. UT-1RO-CII-1]